MKSWFLRAGMPVLIAVGAGSARAQDCDRNGIPDDTEFAPVLDLADLPALPVGENPAFVHLADIDGDSRPDLIVGSQGPWDLATSSNLGGKLTIFLQRGGGRFEVAPEIAAGDNLSSLLSGDFDGDGLLDLGIANFGKGNGVSYVGCAISILRGAGDGTFG